MAKVLFFGVIGFARQLGANDGISKIYRTPARLLAFFAQQTDIFFPLSSTFFL
ncbi:hypothetical protein MUN81_03995 [Hymenobacter sp. 5317J-9]|uniref:hypothetical protein n=1 Tax=Hymenobacter sp. 5317J-9 TaxID=2932250 RepID=UPI001FD655D0|nr:hypothetical protein [Hymenobacter sp. 5317J-9]UOQ98658.1 hypothetical protein MUN81_03995 [Hymenobacter sp. 5317J-9]